MHEIADDKYGGGRSLIFVSEGGFRRVRAYPSDWRELEPGALWELSWRR